MTVNVREENKRLKQNLDRVSMENQDLRTQLGTADRAAALAIFMKQSPSKFAAAHIIGMSEFFFVSRSALQDAIGKEIKLSDLTERYGELIADIVVDGLRAR